jgi:hypothetical protein
MRSSPVRRPGVTPGRNLPRHSMPITRHSIPVHTCVAEVRKLGPADRPLNSCRAGDGAHTCVVSSPLTAGLGPVAQVTTQSPWGQKGVSVLAFMNFIWGLLKAPFIALKHWLDAGAETETLADCSAPDGETPTRNQLSDQEINDLVRALLREGRSSRQVIPRCRRTRPHGRQTRPGPRARSRHR